MINSVLIVTGILLQILSVVICIKLIKINTVKKLQWPWYLLLCLILFFLFGYIAYLFLNTNYGNIPVNSLLISLILFFGAIFVICVLSISYQLINTLLQQSAKLHETNKSLADNTQILTTKQSELEKIQLLLKEKNSELQKTLENFYTLRIGMQKDLEAGKLEAENKKIKERLDELKSSPHKD